MHRRSGIISKTALPKAAICRTESQRTVFAKAAASFMRARRFVARASRKKLMH
jgi:hypothetical protein